MGREARRAVMVRRVGRAATRFRAKILAPALPQTVAKEGQGETGAAARRAVAKVARAVKVGRAGTGIRSTARGTTGGREAMAARVAVPNRAKRGTVEREDREARAAPSEARAATEVQAAKAACRAVASMVTVAKVEPAATAKTRPPWMRMAMDTPVAMAATEVREERPAALVRCTARAATVAPAVRELPGPIGGGTAERAGTAVPTDRGARALKLLHPTCRTRPLALPNRLEGQVPRR